MSAQAEAPAVALRPPAEVMRLQRMGAFFPTRLSFMRSLLRRLQAEGAEVSRPLWEIGPEGYGRALYSVPLGGRTYSLAAFATPLEPERRTDRVIAEAWDSSYVLYDGVPDRAELDRLEANAPRQEAGRYAASDLVLSRANKSLRLFEHAVESLAAGRQPDRRMVQEIGYFMRTTAVYGNGKFGLADRARIARRPGLEGPFQAEMLTVWLIRGFTQDLVEHGARARNPAGAALLAPDLKRYLGIGNATGLGMAPFLVSHPLLLNNWMLARETALARVRAVTHPSPAERARFRELLERAGRHLEQWSVEDRRQMERIRRLRGELRELAGLAGAAWLARPAPWERLMETVAGRSEECQELLVSLLLEPYGRLVDGLAAEMASDGEPALQPAMRLAALAALLRAHCGWALALDFGAPEETALFWYVSEEKLEPRLGLRREEPGAEKEMPLDVARQLQALAGALAAADPEESVAAFLLRRPELRQAVRRLQTLAAHPYAEIRDNLIGAGCLPIDLLRCKLSFFGAAKFDPKSDRWTRITLFQGAPTREEIATAPPDDWCFPVLEAAP